MTRTSKVIALALWVSAGMVACTGGDQPSQPQQRPQPVQPQAEPEPQAVDTANPELSPEEEAARVRREFFEAVERGEDPELPEGMLAAAPDSEPAPTPDPEPVQPAPAPVKPAPAPVKPAPAPVVSRPRPAPAPVPMPQPTTSMTRPVSPSPSPTVPRSTGEPEPAVAMVEPGEEPPEGISEGDALEVCGDPTSLQQTASRGELPEAKISCIESAFARSRSSVDREQLSVLLLTNASAAGNVEEQKHLMARHLEEVDGGNPEIAYRYALLLMSEGTADPQQVVALSNTALTHRAVWTGDTYEKRVYSLYKLRAAAAKQVMDQAIAAHEESASDSTELAAYRARQDTKRYAREWYAYAEQLGMPSSSAKELCLVAARSAAWCEGS